MAIVIRDDFTDTDAVTLQAHTATWAGGAGIGAWTKEGGGAANQVIRSNRVAGDDDLGATYYSSGAPGADVEIRLNIWITNNSDNAPLYIKFRRNTTDYYELRVWNGTTRPLQFRWHTVDNFGFIGAAWDSNWANLSAHEIVIKCEGTSIILVADGTERINATDSRHSAAGSVGMDNTSSSAGTTGIHVDDIEVGGIGETGGGAASAKRPLWLR